MHARAHLESPLYRLPPKIRSLAITGDFPEIAKAVEIVSPVVSRFGVTLFAGGAGDMTVPVRLDPTTRCASRSWA